MNQLGEFSGSVQALDTAYTFTVQGAEHRP
jgi:hypothetical protein